MDITSSLLFLQVILYGYLCMCRDIIKMVGMPTDGICNIHSPALFIKTGVMSKKKSTTPVNVNSDVCDEKHIGRSYVKGQLQKKHYNINYAATYKWTWLEGNIYQFGGGWYALHWQLQQQSIKLWDTEKYNFHRPTRHKRGAEQCVCVCVGGGGYECLNISGWDGINWCLRFNGALEGGVCRLGFAGWGLGFPLWGFGIGVWGLALAGVWGSGPDPRALGLESWHERFDGHVMRFLSWSLGT